MTLQELCRKYKLSEKTVSANFARTQENILKKYGVKIIKTGRGANAEYTEEEYKQAIKPAEEWQHAAVIYQEARDFIILEKENLSFGDIVLAVVIGISFTPMGVYRGTYESFLRYLALDVTKSNVDRLKKGLEELQDKKYIQYNVDFSNVNKGEVYFTANFLREKETQMRIDKDIIIECKNIAELEGERNWLSLFKVWVATSWAMMDEPFTIADLKQLTGMSEYMIRKCNNILQSNKYEIFKTKLQYYTGRDGKPRCIGKTVEDIEKSKLGHNFQDIISYYAEQIESVEIK